MNLIIKFKSLITKALKVFGNAEITGNLTVDTNTLYVDSSDGNVGIGTTTPNEKLTVSGNISATGSLTVNGSISGQNISTGGNGFDDNGKLVQFQDGGSVWGSSTYRGGIFGLAIGDQQFGSSPIGVVGQANGAGLGGWFWSETGADHVRFGGIGQDVTTITRDKGALKWVRGAFGARIHPVDELTAERVYQLPNDSGTVALIPADTAVTGTTVLTNAEFGVYGITYVCSGSDTDYTVTLPLTTSADIGKLIHFRMARIEALTKFVTLVGAEGQLIDGLNQRTMWAGETATLRSTGSGWTKVAGRSIPLKGKATNISGDGAGYTQLVTPFSDIVVNLVEMEFDNSSSMVDLSDPNNRINIRRSGTYQVNGCVYWDGSAGWTASRAYGRIVKVGGPLLAFSECSVAAGTHAANTPSGSVELQQGDAIQLIAYQDSGADRPLINFSHCSISAVEIPDW